EIHSKIASPPIKYPCYYGIDTPTKKELIASKKTVRQIRDFLGVDSLQYLSLQGLVDSIGINKEKFCLACFTGDYPI
ncbi:MAG: amidophosphoribosyltransferase, partial [Elusimicrobiota bacterium]